MFVYDIGVKDKFLGVIVRCFYRMFEFTVVEPLSLDESPDLCVEFTGLV